jgi:hypothetical protein
MDNQIESKVVIDGVECVAEGKVKPLVDESKMHVLSYEFHQGIFYGSVEVKGSCFVPNGYGDTLGIMRQNIKEVVQDYILNEGANDEVWKSINFESDIYLSRRDSKIEIIAQSAISELKELRAATQAVIDAVANLEKLTGWKIKVDTNGNTI